MKQRILLRGEQGLDLLHRISSLDIHGLNPGQAAAGLILSPEGRILSVFTATLQSGGTVMIQCDAQFLPQLERYTFSERYEIEPLPAPTDEPELEDEPRILAMIPKEGFEFLPDGKTNPLEINLRHAISDQKGCYPGQEVIEKIISTGSPARKLCLLRAVRPVPPGSQRVPEPLLSGEGLEVGTLTSFTGNHGLALIRRTHLKEGILLRSGSTEWEVLKVSS